MPTDGRLNPSATYVEESNASHTPPGGQYAVTRGPTTPCAVSGPMTRRTAPVADPLAVTFYTGSHTDASVAP